MKMETDSLEPWPPETSEGAVAEAGHSPALLPCAYVAGRRTSLQGTLVET